jgi:dihydrofolate synthase/folylpolyglutamate synthase
VRGPCCSRLQPEPAAPGIAITVGGTNGKGSCVALSGSDTASRRLYRVGAYTSPHLLRYNERIRIDGAAVDDATTRSAETFAHIDAARGDISLTYFEFGTSGGAGAVP